jgi:hypothetical protein
MINSQGHEDTPKHRLRQTGDQRLAAPTGPSAWHFVGDEALDDPIAVPDAVVCAVPGSPQTELAPGNRQRGVDLPRADIHAPLHSGAAWKSKPYGI